MLKIKPSHFHGSWKKLSR